MMTADLDVFAPAGTDQPEPGDPALQYRIELPASDAAAGLARRAAHRGRPRRRDGRLEVLTLKNNKTGVTTTVPASALIVLIGAEPRTGWLPDGITRDEHGFIVTGSDLTANGSPPAGWPPQRPPC